MYAAPPTSTESQKSKEKSLISRNSIISFAIFTAAVSMRSLMKFPSILLFLTFRKRYSVGTDRDFRTQYRRPLFSLFQISFPQNFGFLATEILQAASTFFTRLVVRTSIIGS